MQHIILKRFTKLIKDSAQQLAIYGRNFIPNSTLQLLFCVCGRFFYMHSFKYPIGRNPGPHCKANVRSEMCQSALHHPVYKQILETTRNVPPVYSGCKGNPLAKTSLSRSRHSCHHCNVSLRDTDSIVKK